MKHSQVNLAGKSKVFLIVLMAWQILRLLAVLAVSIGVIVGLAVACFTFVGIPGLLIALGALALAPQVSPSRRRTIAIAWW